MHSASANEGRTRDGVAAGGRRLAAEVEQLVTDVARRGGSLRTISLVGNSLVSTRFNRPATHYLLLSPYCLLLTAYYPPLTILTTRY